MIEYDSGGFRLTTEKTSYLFRITKQGHLEHVYYGERLPSDQDMEPLAVKRSAEIGTCIAYSNEDKLYCLDNICLEWSGTGKGDFRDPPSEIKMPDGSFMTDFVYQSHQVVAGTVPIKGLPAAGSERGQFIHITPEPDCHTLILEMKDESNDVVLTLYYCVFHRTDVITRRAVLTNNNEKPLIIRKLMSMMLDMANRDFRLITLDGGWIKEAHRHERPLAYGMYVNSSTTGASSNRHNPGFLLAEKYANETSGLVYAFNLIYSGNHYGAVELSGHDLVRVELGINPHCFEWTLESGGSFETPEAVMSVSKGGFGGLSDNMHDFINAHIVRGEWQYGARPVLYNNWEATFFKFNRRKLLSLARRARSLGAELFVLDDGWFRGRTSDAAGLGDYTVDRKKLPGGLASFAKKIRSLGMSFGLWFEPEMVNEDSELFRAHPEYAVTVPGKTPAKGRNQLVLDLCNPVVRDYIVDNVGRVLDETKADYVKWDFNRHLSDAYSPTLKNQGEFYHCYVLGLYDILNRIFGSRPHILFESCASGGNRFDLGMLCYSPQIWASDDTDPIERIGIQGGLSLLYPLSTMGAHVSDVPHQQTLRYTPLTTRFNISAFGCLGYELDLRYLSRVQRREIREQITFYKEHRRTFQYGRFSRSDTGTASKSNKTVWHVAARDDSEIISGLFQTLATASESPDRLTVPVSSVCADAKYVVRTRPQSLFISRFGGLVKHILPVGLDPDGVILKAINRVYRMTDCVEEYTVCGRALADGIQLNNQFMGSNYNEHTRLLGDFGSNLYVATNYDRKER